MEMNTDTTVPETWHDTDDQTVADVEAWIQRGHPAGCQDRLEEIVELGDLRYETARSMFLAHAIREHEVGLDVLARAFTEKGIYGDSSQFIREAIEERGAGFVDQVLDAWGEISRTPGGLPALGTIVGALNIDANPPAPPASMNALAKNADASFAWVHEVVTDLSERGWVKTEGAVEITDAVSFFDWWGQNRTKPTAHRFHVPDPAETAEQLLHEHGIDHAITTYFAENAIQGHLFPRRLDTYVRGEDLEHAREAVLELGGSVGGTTLRLLTGDDSVVDEAVVGRGPAELLYAPLPQVIVDLITEGGSAREAADLLIQRAYPHAQTSL